MSDYPQGEPKGIEISTMLLVAIADVLADAIEKGVIVDQRYPDSKTFVNAHLTGNELIGFAAQKSRDPEVRWPNKLKKQLDKLLSELPE